MTAQYSATPAHLLIASTMDVQCERCNTEYEFDDALVSGRGTTVKCTNCGHKFKIRRRDGDFSEDFWNVQTGDGRTLVFTSLRELQRAIQTNLVDRNDRLSRGGLPQKAIGQIPELAPFFEQREQKEKERERERRRTPPPAGQREDVKAAKTLVDGSNPFTASRSSRPPPPPGATAPALAPPRQRLSTRPDFPPQNPHELEPPHSTGKSSAVKTLTGVGADAEVEEAQRKIAQAQAAQAAAAASAVPAAPAMRARLASVKPVERAPSDPGVGAGRGDRFPDEEPDTTPFHRSDPPAERPRSAPPLPAPPRPSLGAPRGRTTSAPPQYEVSSPLPAPVAPAMRQDAKGYEPDEYEAAIRSSLPDAPHSFGRRRSVGGYVVAAIVIGGVALVGFLWARDHLGPGANAKPAASAPADPRVTALLGTGEKALADGDLDTAKESFDKASALAEKDPHVLLDVARLAASRADVPWLKSRLAGDNADEQRLAKQSLADLSAAARKAADAALAVSPDDPAAVRAKVDALRIAGERDAARSLVSKVASSATQPETAYVLAALDLSENEPLWSMVVERLRVAASAESGPGRARAALAYALARSGDVSAGKAEVERLSSMPRSHVLLPLLRSFVDKAKPTIATIDAHALDGGPALDPKHPGDKHGGAVVGAGSSDPRVLVAQAEKARAKGEYDKALGLYNSALEHNPNDTEALSGVASISYARRDLAAARTAYKRVLSNNPSYVPALVGVGDVDWDSGDKASAMRAYKEIVDRFPEGTYPARVKQRLDSAAAPVPAPQPTPAPGPSEPAPPASGSP